MSVNLMLSIGKGLQASQDRAMRIRAARDEKRQKDELLDLKKQEYQLRLEKLRKTQADDAVTQSLLGTLEEQLSNQFKLADAQSAVEDDQIAGALRAEEDRTQTLRRTGNKVAAALMREQPGGVVSDGSLDWSFNTGSKSFTLRPKSQAKGSGAVPLQEKVMGAIDLGSFIKNDEENPLSTRAESEKYAVRELGYNWKTRFPEVLNLIDRKFPEKNLDLTTGIRAGLEAGKISGEEKVWVEFNGQQGSIPKKNLQEAIKRGARVIR